ncbi:MAG: type II toxin-antitoxin system VapC family toxin [Acidobacteria bacterium]|nr:type II toxin-antitoxin system VapC family toxin [Acidobacteriota bacterium]
MIVVDASVAVKWFFPEEGEQQALGLLDGAQMLVAPDLIRVEVANAIIRKYRLQQLSQADAKETIRLWVEALKNGVVQVTATLDDLLEAASLSLQLEHSMYDCLYLAVARRTSSKLITADARFAEKAVSVYPGVVSLLTAQ